MEKNSDQLKNMADKLTFDAIYGKYLQKKYPGLYKKGIKFAVEKCHCHRESMAAFLYAIGFVEGFLSTTEIAQLIQPKTIH